MTFTILIFHYLDHVRVLSSGTNTMQSAESQPTFSKKHVASIVRVDE
jgi:hypothetical protein